MIRKTRIQTPANTKAAVTSPFHGPFLWCK